MTSCIINFAVPREQLKDDASKYMGGMGLPWPLQKYKVTLYDLKPELLEQKPAMTMSRQLDHRGFAVFKHKSEALGSLGKQLQWNSAYLQETAQVVKEQLEADAVFVWNSVARSFIPEPQRLEGKQPVQARAIFYVNGLQFTGSVSPIASCAHIDQDASNSRQMCKSAAACENVFAKYSRVQQLNFWRPLAGPVAYRPLAVCDGSTVHENAFLHKGTSGARVPVHHNETQKWYYIKQQEADECLLFKNYDSCVLAGQAACTPHSCVEDIYGVDGPETPRESIEARLVVCYV